MMQRCRWYIVGVLLMSALLGGCVETAECNESGGCPEGEICYRFECRARCEKDEDCQEDLTCRPCDDPETDDNFCFGERARACVPTER